MDYANSVDNSELQLFEYFNWCCGILKLLYNRLNQLLSNPKQRMPNQDLDERLKNLALVMAVHCVRNTIIEDYHSRGNISDPEMMAFNKEVVDNLYTFLQIMHNPMYKHEKEALSRENTIFYIPHGWDEPKLKQSTISALQNMHLMI